MTLTFVLSQGQVKVDHHANNKGHRPVGLCTMNYCPVTFCPVLFFVTDGQTDGQTESDAYGLKNTLDHSFNLSLQAGHLPMPFCITVTPTHP